MLMSDENFDKFAEKFDADKADKDTILQALTTAGLTDKDYDDEDIEDLIKIAEDALLSKVDNAADSAAASTMGMTGKAAAAMNGDAYFPEAKRMANEDQTEIKVTEEDKDSDGDTDKVTVEKETPEDDMELTDEERAVIDSMGSDEGTEEPDNSSETEDKPHEEPKFKNKTNQFARFLGENRLGGM